VAFDPQNLVLSGWVGLGAIWLVAGLATKRTSRRAPAGPMIVHGLVLALIFSLVLARTFSLGFLRTRFVPAGDWVRWTGCVLCYGGIVFAIWARYCLGRNWSGMVTVKEDHTLVRSGPYKLVRHPIYTGLSLALLGSAVVFGELHCLIGAALAVFEWKRKSLIEERFMIEQFGRDYVSYRRQVKALIPFVW
jgi:protein-S-isoprenylcysteine O-methyltransferase Ste14